MILTIDFGSTFTKVTAICDETANIAGTAKAFTTIETDIRDGLNTALAELHSQTGPLEYTHRLAASSAGGGLKMVAVGLVPALTAKAAHMAACSAGAKVVKTFSYELSTNEAQEIYDIDPDLILLSGGTDGGNKDVILHNANKLAAVDRGFSVIVAGNKSAAGNAAEILRKTGKDAVVCSNVMPAFNVLDIMPAKDAIRALFMEKIIAAKGLGEAAKMMSAPIIPTPLAVFEGAQLLAQSLGTLMAVDVGGATTDVYSMCAGAPTLPNVTQKGLSEPFAKRTVEGDLGLRYSLEALAEAVNRATLLNSPVIPGLTRDTLPLGKTERSRGKPGMTGEHLCKKPEIDASALTDYLAQCTSNPSFVPQHGTPESILDEKLCGIAVDIATERHSGRLERIFTPFGETFYQLGKDLRDVKYVVGIGGPIVYSSNPRGILENAIALPGNHESLKPTNPKFILDKKYIFGAMGLMSRVNRDVALKILQTQVTEV